MVKNPKEYNKIRSKKLKERIESASGNAWWIKAFILGDLKAKRERSIDAFRGI